jgi:hypothetical protein
VRPEGLGKLKKTHSFHRVSNHRSNGLYIVQCLIHYATSCSVGKQMLSTNSNDSKWPCPSCFRQEAIGTRYYVLCISHISFRNKCPSISVRYRKRDCGKQYLYNLLLWLSVFCEPGTIQSAAIFLRVCIALHKAASTYIIISSTYTTPNLRYN